MSISVIKNIIESKVGVSVKVICHCARNKEECYIGKITETYNYIFIVKLVSNENKSFCYSDVITKCIELKFD